MTRARMKWRHLFFFVSLLVIIATATAGCAPIGGLDLMGWGAAIGLGTDTNDNVIEASGTIEAEQVIISSELSGRIIHIHIREGEDVDQGQILVELDDSLIAAQVIGAQADLQAAEARLARVLAGPRPAQVASQIAVIEQANARAAGVKQAWEDTIRLRDNPLELDAQIHAAEGEMRVAEAGVDQARAILSEAEVRYEASKGGGSDAEKTTTEILRVQVEVARANLELAELAVNGAQSTVAELRRLRGNPAMLEAAVHQAEMGYRLAETEIAVREAELALLKAGPLPEEIALAERKVDLARASEEALEIQREKLTLRAPLAGVIASKVVHEGETAMPGATLMTISDLSQVRLVIYVPESQIGRVSLGQPAEVRVDSYPERVFEGRVIHIATEAEFTPRNVQTKEDRVNTVFAVKIELENPEQILKPGMPADATLREAS